MSRVVVEEVMERLPRERVTMVIWGGGEAGQSPEGED